MEHDLLNIVSGSHERFINGWPAEIHFPRMRPIREGKPLEPPLPVSPRHTLGPFLRNPSVKISISTFHSLHSIPRRGSPGLPHPLLCLDEVIKDAAAISGASRADEQAENRPATRAWTPGMHAGIFFEPLNRSPTPVPPLIRSGKNIFGPVCVALPICYINRLPVLSIKQPRRSRG